MKFGFWAMPEHFPWSNWNLAFSLDLEKIQEAERLGYDEYWIGEHHTAGFEPVPVPEYYLAAASAITSKIRLGTGVVNLPYHDPFLVAERLAFLDQMTGGRLIAGFGAGGLPSDVALFETGPTSNPRFDEALDIIEQLWASEEPIDYKGQFWSGNNRLLQVRPYQDRIPIATGGVTSTSKFELCGTRGYQPMSMHWARASAPESSPVPHLKEHIQAAIKAGEAAGYTEEQVRSEWRVIREVYVAEDRETAIRDIRKGIEYSYGYVKAIGTGELIKDSPDQSIDDLTVEWLIDNLPMIVGSPEDCIRQIHDLQEEIGDFGYLFLHDRNWVTQDKWVRSAELFARYVKPAFDRKENLQFRKDLVDRDMASNPNWPLDWWTDRPWLDNQASMAGSHDGL